jgi:hypothetical protein
LIGLPETIRPWQRRLRLGLLLILLGLLVAWAHSGPSMDHMDAGEAVAICFAVVETAVLAAGVRRPTSLPARRAVPATLPVPLPPAVPGPPGLARAGPEALQVFRD